MYAVQVQVIVEHSDMHASLDLVVYIECTVVQSLMATITYILMELCGYILLITQLLNILVSATTAIVCIKRI